MKKIYLLFALLFTFLGFSQFNPTAPWMINTVDANPKEKKLSELVTDFNNYWSTRDKTKRASGYKPFMRWVEQWKNVTNDQGYVISQQELLAAWEQKNQAKRNGNRYTQIFECMFIFSKDKPKTCNLICDKPNKWAGHTNWGKNTNRLKSGELKETTDIKPVPDFSPRNNIWKYNIGKGFNSSDKESHQHPAIFPEQLAEDHILSWSNEGDIVLDPFSGSGTTCKMAKKNKRNYIGIDISEEYCKLAENILNKY